MSKSALRIVSIFFLAITAFGSSIQTSNTLLNKILSSGTPDAFAECSSGPCSLYSFTGSGDLAEDPLSPFHTINFLTFSTSSNQGLGPNVVNNPIVFSIATDAQCTAAPTATIAIGGNTVVIPFTAVDDLIPEATPHFCHVDVSVVSGNLTGNGAGYSYDIGITDNDTGIDSFVTTHSTFSLNEDPSFAESQDVNHLEIDTSGTPIVGATSDNLYLTVATDDQCYVSLDSDFTYKLHSVARFINFALPLDSLDSPFFFKARQDDIVEGNHACTITYAYSFQDFPNLNKIETVIASLIDYRPGVSATAPSILYEKPVGLQSSEGFVKMKLSRQPSDLEPVLATVTNLNPELCVLNNNILTFTNTNWNDVQELKVSAIKDGIYQPGTRDCKIRIVLSSDETPVPSLPLPYLRNPLTPRAILASAKPAILAALEYNAVSQDIIIKVLDADTLPQTGLRSPLVFLGSTVALVIAVLSALYTYRIYVTTTIINNKIQL